MALTPTLAPGALEAMEAFLSDHVEDAGASGAVLGLSGGIDSAVVATVAARALGPKRVTCLHLPIEGTGARDRQDAQRLAERLGVAYVARDLSKPYFELVDTLAPRDRRSRGNVKARLRMVALYAEANRRGALVLGAGNKSELLTGYFTKWGDAAADVVPLGDLLKDEVRALARLLGVPQEVIDRPPTAGLWPGQTDEEEMGLRYADIDAFLLRGTSGDPLVDEKIRMAEAASRHKRNPPPLARPE